MIRYRILTVFALSAISATALAHNGATGVVMERMMGMSAMRDAMRDIAPMMQGQADYDKLAVQAAAAVLQQHAGETMTQLFPQEAISSASYARPEIWSDWDRFSALAEELRVYAEGLTIAAPNGLDAPEGDTGAMASMDHSNMQMDLAPTRFSVAELMGVAARESASPVIGASSTESVRVSGVDFAMMAADDVFEKIGQTCAACHSAYRKGK